MYDSSDNNSHTLFIFNAAVGEEMEPNGMPLYETYDLGTVQHTLVAGDYEGIMSTTLVYSGDVIDTEVSFHVTEDGLVDVERI